jgi:hypothetical protein
MVKSAIDRTEQAQLVELFTAMEPPLAPSSRLAEAVTFWRYQLTVGVESSQLTELLALLDEVAALPGMDARLRARIQDWRLVLEPRASIVEPWRSQLDRHEQPSSSVSPTEEAPC